MSGLIRMDASTAIVNEAPGWFGKIPALGDFASRRLPSRFVVAWDDWLQRALASSQGALGDAWQSEYLTAPIWHFLLMPGVLGARAWAGVLMPSVDNVGRNFPLTVARELTVVREDADWVQLKAWSERVEHAALGSLSTTATLGEFDAALAQISAPACAGTANSAEELPALIADRLDVSSERASCFSLPSVSVLPQLLTQVSAALLFSVGAKKSLWWSGNKVGRSPMMICCDELPAADLFHSFLTGKFDPSAQLA